MPHPPSAPAGLNGQVALVTGAARGIGAAIARALAREGARIAVADVGDAHEAVQRIRAAGSEAIAVPCNVADIASVTVAVAQTLHAFGRIDILVNNAGVTTRAGVEEITLDQWNRDLGVILTGTFLMTQAVYAHMKARGGGKIINIASVSGKNGGTTLAGQDAAALKGRTGPAYAAAKGGVIALTKWVAKDGGPHGIYCNAICPGATDTEMTRGYVYNVHALPIARMGKPEDIAEAAVFLASAASNYITGQAINVDGGMVME